MENDKPKKQLSTPMLVLVVFLATALVLGAIVLVLLIMNRSSGPARTDIGNELVETIDAVDDLIAEFETTQGCEVDVQAVTAKHDKVNQQVLTIIAQAFGQIGSEPSQDLLDDIEEYSPLLESRGQKLEEVAGDLANRCGFELPDPNL